MVASPLHWPIIGGATHKSALMSLCASWKIDMWRMLEGSMDFSRFEATCARADLCIYEDGISTEHTVLLISVDLAAPSPVLETSLDTEDLTSHSGSL